MRAVLLGLGKLQQIRNPETPGGRSCGAGACGGR